MSSPQSTPPSAPLAPTWFRQGIQDFARRMWKGCWPRLGKDGAGRAGKVGTRLAVDALMLRALAIALVLCLAAPVAQAASVPELRAALNGSETKARSAHASRVEAQKALDEVASKIESLKAQQQGLFGDAELDTLLKRSQELSGRMTDALRAENEADEALRGGQAKLVNELDSELSRLRARWDAAKSREERAGLLAQLKALRAERDSLRGAMPAALVPQVSSRPSDDPEELLERADALYDGEDKLRREEQALSRRIDELKTERDLERRMNEFLGEDALFDEHDRRIKALSPTKTVAPQTFGGYSDSTPGTLGTRTGTSDPVGTITLPSTPKSPADTLSPAGSPSTNGYYTNSPSQDTGKTTALGAGDPSPNRGPHDTSTFGTQGSADPVSATPAAHAGVTTSQPDGRAAVAPYSEDEGLDQLAARRAQLKKLADEMHQRADEAARRAKDLK
jgi:hypothetical protein